VNLIPQQRKKEDIIPKKSPTKKSIGPMTATEPKKKEDNGGRYSLRRYCMIRIAIVRSHPIIASFSPTKPEHAEKIRLDAYNKKEATTVLTKDRSMHY
jgi:hypothetical protein